ncbi:MAG: hypothetical protein U0V64_14435 [Cyclobacteriaceae bacterium]
MSYPSIPYKPIGILYEHPCWFKPLFEELLRRHIPFVRINAAHHQYNPAEKETPFSMVVNRVSPTAHFRGHGAALQHTLNYLHHLEGLGVRVINGSTPFEIELSKARQINIFQQLGLPFPRTRIVNHLDQILPASFSLRYPLLVRPVTGGNGLGVYRFEQPGQLQKAIQLRQVSLGPDHHALIQEYIRPYKQVIIHAEIRRRRFFRAWTLPATGAVHVDGGKGTVAWHERKEFQPESAIIHQLNQIAERAALDFGSVDLVTSEETRSAVYLTIDAIGSLTDVHPDIFQPQSVSLAEYLEEEWRRLTDPSAADSSSIHNTIPLLQ